MLNPVVGSLDCNIAGREPFSCSLESVRLGMLDVLRYDGHGLKRSRRALTHIRESRVDNFFATFPTTAPLAISQSGRVAVTPPGSTALLTTARPFDCLFDASGNAYSQLMLRIPGPLLRRHVPHIDECCARAIDVRRGAGRILHMLVESLVDGRNDYSASQAERFGAVLLDAFANVAMEAPELSALRSPRGETTQARILERAQAFIESRLSDPELDPVQVADHCRISVRYLHAVFAASSLGVATFIRELRLQRCREALLNPLLRERAIIEIAMRWGFGSTSSFNRAYRARFATSPSRDRETLLRAVLPH